MNTVEASPFFFTHKSGDPLIQRLELRLKLDGNVSDTVSYGIRFDIFSRMGHSLYPGTFPESDPLGSPILSETVSLSLYEAYIKLSDVLFEGLDVTIGKQRIQWGTADKVNVVDVLNPIDFAQFFTFDPDWFMERRPRPAVRIEYAFGQTGTLDFIWFPTRAPAPLPFGVSQFFLGSARNGQVYVLTPKEQLGFNEWGFRLGSTLLGVDFQFMVAHQAYQLPVLTGTMYDPDLSVTLTFSYPSYTTAGLAFSGELFSIGFWGEAAYVKPEKVFLTFQPSPYGPILKTPLLDAGYWRYVFGFDYTIGNGLYFNLQYLHGLFDERGYESSTSALFPSLYGKGIFFGNLEDYAIGRLEYTFYRNSIKLSFNVMVEWGDNATAILYLPSAEFRIMDRLIVDIGAMIVSGDRTGAKFGLFRDERLGYALAKIDF